MADVVDERKARAVPEGPEGQQSGPFATEVVTLGYAPGISRTARRSATADDEFDLDVRLIDLRAVAVPGAHIVRIDEDKSGQFTCRGATCETCPHTVCDSPCQTEGMMTCNTCYTKCESCETCVTCETCATCNTCGTCETCYTCYGCPQEA